MRERVILSLFPGIGLLDIAFEEEGFCVVRGPDLLWGGDIRIFHPPVGKFDGVIGGPPCQAFSRLVYLVIANGYEPAENLIPEFERCVREACPRWFLMENVCAAPEPEIDGYAVSSIVLNNRWLPDSTKQSRKRRFSFGFFGHQQINLEAYMEFAALEPFGHAHTVCAKGGYRPVPVRIGGSGKVKATAAQNLGYYSSKRLKEMIFLQGLPEEFFEYSPLTVKGKMQMLGNGVPLPMGRAVAKAVKRAIMVEAI